MGIQCSWEALTQFCDFSTVKALGTSLRGKFTSPHFPMEETKDRGFKILIEKPRDKPTHIWSPYL